MAKKFEILKNLRQLKCSSSIKKMFKNSKSKSNSNNFQAFRKCFRIKQMFLIVENVHKYKKNHDFEKCGKSKKTSRISNIFQISKKHHEYKQYWTLENVRELKKLFILWQMFMNSITLHKYKITCDFWKMFANSNNKSGLPKMLI